MTTRKKCIVSVLLAALLIMSTVPFLNDSESAEFVRADSQDKSFPLTTDGDQLEIDHSTDGDVDRISYNINGFDTNSVNIDETEYDHISIEGATNSLKEGYPDLPTVSRSLIIPDDKEMEIKVNGGEYVEYDSVELAPSKGSLSRTEHPDISEVPYEFGEVYEEDAWYPEDIAQLRDPYIVRDFRGQVVELTPFQYHPTENRLRVYTEVEVEVFPDGRGGKNVLTRSSTLDSIQRDFARIYERRFINYEETLNGLRYDPVEEEGNMLVISDDDYSSAMTDFVDWKNSRGLSTELVDLSEVGSTADDISNYIENYYNNEGLTYVLLVGDNDRVPTPIVNTDNVDSGDHASDPSYSFIEGDDYYPDLFVGRFSASDVSHVETQVERSVDYEQNPDLDGEWRTKGIGLASDEGPGYNDLMDYEHMDILRDRLLDYEYTHVDRFYDSGNGDLDGSPDSGHVSDAVEDGRHLINYVGHGMTTYIATSGFDTGDMDALTNDKLPFFITVACLTGEHDASTDPCFGEQWTRVTHNGEPAGGIAAFSCSKSQAWAEPMSAQDEMMYILAETYEDNIKTTTAGIAFNGCMFMNDEYGQNGEYETATWHIFGDPSLEFNGEAIPEGNAPEIEVTSPMNGEVWQADTQEDITWDTTAGDDPIDYVNLHYSVDGGASFETIATEVEDTGSYTWNVPNEDSEECQVKAEVVDEVGRTNESISGDFTIEGTPPAPPENLNVEHNGRSVQVLFEDDVSEDLGYTTEVSDAEASEWGIRQHDSVVGSNSWDFGDGEFNKNADYGMLSSLTTPEIEIPAEADEEYGVNFTFQHWRDFGDTSLYDGGNVKISTDGGSSWSVITPEEGYDGTINDGYSNPLGGESGWGNENIGWETATFDLTEHIGETIHLRWDAGVEAWDGYYGAGWRVDDIYMEALISDPNGTDHNQVSWDASPDDSDEVGQYNIYRSADQSGPWDGTTLIDSVPADGSVNYSYLDEDRGEIDDTYWWYVVRAEGENGLEEENADAVQEPGAGTDIFEISLTTDTQSDDWNFVSFNLVPANSDLTAILDDADYGIDGNYDKVMYYDASTDEWLSYIPGRDNFNDDIQWDETKGLWIQMNTDDTLTVEGTEPTNTDITLNPGWNMVGYPSSTAAVEGTPAEVSIVGYFDAAQNNNLAYDYDPANFEFSPGEGYYLYNDADYDVTWSVEY